MGEYMYSTDKRADAVRELQRNLGLIEANSFSTVPSGLYDTETALAVNEFQRNSGLAATGIADYPTFEAIYRCGTEDEKERIRKKKYKSTQFPIAIGDGGVAVYNLNVMLSDILSFYGLYFFNGTGSFFDKNTEEAVNIAAMIFGYEPTREVNSGLYERIELEYLSINV